MRLCSYWSAGEVVPGRVDSDRVIALENPSVEAIILDAEVPRQAEPDAGEQIASVELLEPFQPATILGVGLNYREHAAETGREPPAEPMIFAKLAGAIAPPSGTIRRPAYTSELDYEGELAVIVGQAARDVPVEDALAHVFGYAVMNDVSARDRQRDEPRWIRAKGGDGFAPFGPWITTADDVPDPQDLRIRTWVNDELRQDGNTHDMVFGVAQLISWCSRQFTLHAGDVITTGTPAGVGVGFDPPRFLNPGDRVRVEIDGLGGLEHEVIEG